MSQVIRHNITCDSDLTFVMPEHCDSVYGITDENDKLCMFIFDSETKVIDIKRKRVADIQYQYLDINFYSEMMEMHDKLKSLLN